MNSSKNELWADLIRVFAIFGVVSLHTLGTYPSWFSTYAFKIFETSVPLFVMLSGALLLGKTESYTSFFKKRSVKVLIPWIVWTIIYMVFFYFLKDKYILSNYFSSEGININNWGKFFFIQFFTGLWFLPLIFGIYLITPPLRIFIKSARRIDFIYILSLWFIFISLFPSIFSSSLFPNWLPLFIYAPIQYSGYFILGYVLINRKEDRFMNLPIWYIFPLLAFILILPIKSFIEPAIVLASIFIFAYIYSFSNKIESKISPKLRVLISMVSAASLGIYVIHAVFTYTINNRTDLSEAFASFGFLYTLIIFIMSFIAVYFLQKLPVIKNIVP